MARPLRWENADGMYHVINRGNYRRDVFETDGAAQSFVATLEEAVAKHGWRLQAYVVMRNHFHLVLETPHANLSQGMHWLLCTFAIRFNRYRSERGHLFQGRFQALPIEDYRVMGIVVDYVHLNPVRAHVVPADRVGDFPWSSLSRFLRNDLFPGLDPAGALGGRGWDDSAGGWAGYAAHLMELASNLEEQKRLGFDGFSSGWAIGSNDWQRAIARERALGDSFAGLTGEDAAAIREARWQLALERCLSNQGRSREEALADRKTKVWKIRLAYDVRAASGASIGWLSRKLNLGAEGSVRSLFAKMRR